MADDLLFGAQYLYFATAGLLGIGGVVFLGIAVLQSGYKRVMLVLGAAPALFMSVAYAMMGLELLTVTVTGTGGREQSIARFFAYTAVLSTVVYVVRELIELSERQFVVGLIPFVTLPWAALASWVTTGTLETAMSATAFLAYLFGAYLLYGPFTRVARSVSGERRLLYVKLCHLAVICWGALILTSGLSEQAAGILDFFVGQLVASYVDLVFMLVFAGLLYTNRTLFEGTYTGRGND